MRDNKEHDLLDLEFSKGKLKLKMALTFFKGIPKIDIREYYFDRKVAEYKPSRKGIQLDSSRAEALLAALKLNSKYIDMHLLNEDLSEWSKDIKKISSSNDYFSDNEFYKSVMKGSENEIVFNLNHPLGLVLQNLSQSNKGNNTEVELIKTLLLSFERSLSQFDHDSKVQAGDLIFDLKSTWSILLKRILRNNI